MYILYASDRTYVYRFDGCRRTEQYRTGKKLPINGRLLSNGHSCSRSYATYEMEKRAKLFSKYFSGDLFYPTYAINQRTQRRNTLSCFRQRHIFPPQPGVSRKRFEVAYIVAVVTAKRKL